MKQSVKFIGGFCLYVWRERFEEALAIVFSLFWQFGIA